MTQLRSVGALGESPSLEHASCTFVMGGEFERLAAAGISGLTSNPTICPWAIAAGHTIDSDAIIAVARRLAAGGSGGAEPPPPTEPSGPAAV